MTHAINRRRLLTGAGTGAAALAFGAFWRPAEASAEPDSRPLQASYLTIDVACIGPTFAPIMAGALNADDGDLRGVSFSVEGHIYPGGTLPTGEEIDIDEHEDEVVGLWLCRGWLMVHPGRLEPAGVTHQEYLLGEVSTEHPSPADQLTSSGVEGGVETVRTVTGGTGRYRRRRGEVIQDVLGTNSTILNVLDMPAPNFRFHFFN